MIRFYTLFILGFLFSCDIINPEEEIPSFIEIENFELTATPGTGSNSHNITEGWVYVDNVLIGAYSPDKPFPVLFAGSHEILVDPGIHENGISLNPSLYPYYTRYATTVDLVPGEVTKISPVFEYRDNIDFLFIEEFDAQTLFTIDRDLNENTNIAFETVGALEGVSAKIVLDEDNPIVNIATSEVFDLPTTGGFKTFLEINFKTDVPIAIGLLTSDDFGNIKQLYGNGLNTTPEWKKVYINLQEIVINNPTPPYQVGFGATLPDGFEQATIMLDNIKLLHFKQ